MKTGAPSGACFISTASVQNWRRDSPIDAKRKSPMMPAIVPAVVTVIADAARAIISPDDPAAMRVGIVIRRVTVIARAEVMPVRDPESAIAIRAVAIAAAAEHVAGVKSAATEHGAAAAKAAAVNGRAANAKASTAMEASTAAETSA